MKVLSFVLFFCFSFPAWTLPDQFLEMAPDRSYMKFVISRYIRTFESEFGDSLSRHDRKTGYFVSRLLAHTDHWLVDGNLFLTQFDLRFSIQEKRTFLTTRIFVHPQARKEPRLVRPELPRLPVWFYQWDQGGTECVYLKNPTAQISFTEWCRSSEKESFRQTGTEEYVSEKLSGWPLVFPTAEAEEIRVTRNGSVVSVVHRSDFGHPSLIPSELLKFANFNQSRALFHLRRYATDAAGNLTLHYP